MDEKEFKELIRVGEALRERVKRLAKEVDAAIHASRLIAIEARQLRTEIARRRGAKRTRRPIAAQPVERAKRPRDPRSN